MPGPVPGHGNAAGSENQDGSRPPQTHGLAAKTTPDLCNWRNVDKHCGSIWTGLNSLGLWKDHKEGMFKLIPVR